MNSITRHFKFLSEQLQAKKDTLEKLVNLYEYVPPPSPSRPQQSYRQPDGTYTDENGNLVYVPPPPDAIAQPPANEIPPLIAIGEPGSPGVEPLPVAPQPSFPQPQQPTYPTPDRTPPGYVPGTSPTSGVAPTPTGQLPPQPKPQPQQQTPTGPSQADVDQFSGSRAKYYANLNKKAREAAEENLARIGTIDLSRQSASGRSQIAVNKLRAQRAAKADRFSQEDIDRMVASDTKERFMTPEEKAARAERTRAGAAALSAEAEKRYGPGGGVTTVDRRGDNKIQGTNMTFNQFRERYGREYNALNNDDANLVRGAASNFAVGRVSQSAQQAAQTADAMNQAYSAQNADMAQRSGAADRAVDASQIELDRYRNLTPAQRQAEVRAEIAQTQAQPGFVQGVANDMAAGVSAETVRRAAEAERQAFERRAAQPGRAGTPSLLARPEQAPTSNTPQLLRRPEGAAPEAPSLLQAPAAQSPTRPRYTGAGSVDFAQTPELLRGTENQSSAYTGMGSRSYSPTQPQRNVGGQVTQRASNMSAQPLTGRVSPTAPAAAPRQPLGSTVTPARPQPAPQPSANTGTVNTGGMNQPMDINDFDAEQQTGGPSERNRALPQPSAYPFGQTPTPFAQRPLRGRAVTRAARTFNTRGNATSRLA